jgi:hypothetical protein
LKEIRSNLVGDSYSSSLLKQIDDNSALLANVSHCQLQLLATVALAAVETLARQTRVMNSVTKEKIRKIKITEQETET